MDKELDALEWLNNTLGQFLNKTTDTWCQITLSRDQAIEFVEEHKKVKQALLKTQENEKVLEIVFEKNIDIEALKYRLRFKDDDVYLHYKYDLIMTREEFNLVKSIVINLRRNKNAKIYNLEM